MSSTSETGHAKNLANFKILIKTCSSYAAYNPSRASILLPQLNAQYATCTTDLENVKAAKAVSDVAGNTRKQAFKGNKKFATRIINALAACDVKDEIVADARTIVRKIQGLRSPKQEPPKPGETPGPGKSSSQQSFDLVIDHYQKLWKLLNVEPAYVPNERELSSGDIQNFIAAMQNSVDGVTTTDVDLNKARFTRDNSFYKPDLGMVDNAIAVKKYMLSVLGTSSAEYKKIKAIAFRNINNR
ncbi:hypothetical protein BH09BAC2_BH09BAC2_03580 [soil metagenome]